MKYCMSKKSCPFYTAYLEKYKQMNKFLIDQNYLLNMTLKVTSFSVKKDKIRILTYR